MTDVIGFVGLGRMGRPLAANLVRKGFDIVVYDLMEEATSRLAAEGAKVAASAADAAAQSDISVTMLPNASHVQSVVQRDVLPNLRPGGIAIDMSTVEPGFMIDLAHKDISIAIDTANRLRVPLAVGAAAREALNIARVRGYGAKDFTALLDNWADLAGVTKPLLNRP